MTLRESELFKPRKKTEEEKKETLPTVSQPLLPDFLPLRDKIEEWLKETPLSDEARKELSEKSLEIYQKIKKIPGQKEEKYKASLFLACDDYRCAVPRVISKPKEKILDNARKETGIKSVEAIQRVDAICKVMKKSPEVAKKAKEILEEYKEEYPLDYAKGSPTITAASVIYIVAQLYGEFITQKELTEFLGISPPSVRKRTKELTEKLSIQTFL